MNNVLIKELHASGFVDLDDPLVVRAREAIDRARHAAARRVRDRPSMANEVLARGLTGSDDRYGRILRESVSWANAIHEGAPDGMVRPTNGAALGALREVVREAWGDPTIHVASIHVDRGAVRWFMHGSRASLGLGTHGSEFEALVACLEAAPC